MSKIYTLLILCSRLSLDAVAVAFIWYLVLRSESGQVISFWEFEILAVSTWLAYGLDHLIDVLKSSRVPTSPRHSFIFRYRKVVGIVWAFLLLTHFPVAFFVLKPAQLYGGLVIFGLTLCYFFCVTLIPSGWRKQLFKRLMVTLLFTAGIVILAEAWVTIDTYSAVTLFFLGAFTNLWLITHWEANCADSNKKATCLFYVGCCLLGLNGAAQLILSDWGLALASTLTIALFIGLYKRSSSLELEVKRSLADTVLIIAGLFLVITANYGWIQ